MKMYIARDEDGRLNLFDVKPQKFVPHYSSRCVWTVPRGYVNHIMLSPEQPMEVELKLVNNVQGE